MGQNPYGRARQSLAGSKAKISIVHSKTESDLLGSGRRGSQNHKMGRRQAGRTPHFERLHEYEVAHKHDAPRARSDSQERHEGHLHARHERRSTHRLKAGAYNGNPQFWLNVAKGKGEAEIDPHCNEGRSEHRDILAGILTKDLAKEKTKEKFARQQSSKSGGLGGLARARTMGPFGSF